MKAILSEFTHSSEVKMYPMTFLAMLIPAPTKLAIVTVMDRRDENEEKNEKQL